MKTFLRTSLFRIVAVIAFLVISGFGYKERRLTPVFNQSYLMQWIPTSVATQIADKNPTETPADPAIQIDTDGTSNATTLPAVRPQEFTQPDNSELLIGQANLREHIDEQFAQLSQQLKNLTSLCQEDTETPTPPIDENAQKKAELQAQIEQLQAEMGNL